MAFLLPGRFLLLQSLLLCFIPHISGSLRTKRVLASDLMPLPKPKSSGNGIPNFASSSTSSPGLFLDLDVPGTTSFLRFYGYNRMAASPYGVCVDCNEDYQSYWILDAYNASSSDSPDPTPSCLLSIALEGHSDHSIKLHNVYDSHFEKYGEINISFVEYVFEEYGSQLLPSQTIDICNNHLRWSGHNVMLSRRGNDAPSPSSPTDSEDLDGKMEIMIGLIAALITIVVVIFFIAAFYALRLRNNERLQRQHDLEGGKNNLLIDSGKSGSQTILSHGETAAQPDKETIDLPAEGYIADQKNATRTTDTGPASSSFSTHTQADATKLNPNRNVNSETSTIASAASRHTQRRTRPPTSPPKEPVPALPTTPTSTPIHYMHTKRRGDNTLLSALPSLSPVQSRRQQGYHSQPAPEEGPQVARNYKDVQDSTGHVHCSDSSSSPTSHESRPPYEVRPPSKHKLTLSVATLESPVRSIPPTSHNQYTNRYSRSDHNKLATTLMQPIRETPSRSSEAIPLQSKGATANPTLRRPRSTEDVRIQAHSETHVLHGSKSSPELEHPEAWKDIYSAESLRVWDHSRIHSRLSVQNASSAVDSSRRKRESIRSQLSWRPQQMRLSLKLPPGSNVGRLLVPEHEGILSPSSVMPDSVYTQATKSRIGQRHIQETKLITAGNTHSQTPTRGARRPPLPLPPSYEQVHPSVTLLDTSPSFIPRKRALPKPPS